MRKIKLIVILLTGISASFLFGILFQKIGYPKKLYDGCLRYVKFQGHKPARLPQLITIQISEESMKLLEENRKEAIKQQKLINPKEVSGKIICSNDTLKAEIKLKGRLPDHFDSELYSLKIKIKDKGLCNGMQSFSIQHPKTRYYLNEWIFHKLLRYAGLIGLTYDFMLVKINERKPELYAVEERFDEFMLKKNNREDGPIFRFDNEMYWSASQFGLLDRFYGSEILPYQKSKILNDTLLSQNFIKAKQQIEGFREGKYTVSEVFNIKKLALFFALFDLLGYHHGCSLDNMKFYYNSDENTIEPIGYDNQVITNVYEQGLIGFHKQINSSLGSSTTQSMLNNKWVENIFHDLDFYQEYMKAIKVVSDSTFLNIFFSEINKDIDSTIGMIQKYYPGYEYDIADILFQNRKIIKEALTIHPSAVIGYFNETEKGQTLQVKNILPFPVIVSGIINGDNTPIAVIKNTIIESIKDNGIPGTTTVFFETVNENDAIDKFNITNYKLKCSLLGHDSIYYTNIRGWSGRSD